MPPYITLPLLAVIALFLLYIFSLLPRARSKTAAPFMRVAYAHRGLHNKERPENSLAAFAAAVTAGYGIELDVQLSRDGVPVVFHDETLTRMCGIDARISDYTAEELKKMPLLGQAEHTSPTLSEVLETVKGRVPLLVEIKGYRKVDPVCSAAAALLDEYKGPYMIESFTPYAVHWFKKNRPAVVRGQLSCHLFKEGKRSFGAFVVQSLCTNFITRPDFIAFSFADAGMLSYRLCRSLFLPYALAFTVKSKKDEARAARRFDSIIFEGYFPERRSYK